MYAVFIRTWRFSSFFLGQTYEEVQLDNDIMPSPTVIDHDVCYCSTLVNYLTVLHEFCFYSCLVFIDLWIHLLSYFFHLNLCIMALQYVATFMFHIVINI